jgi:HAD superfamily hydrolase (TIGR01459 family)
LRFLTGFAEIADHYDGFILDLWGVIHDGVNPIAGAPECLERLHQAGKRSVLLSNAPRRAEVVARQLRKMGIPDEHYTGVMTSGEASHIVLRDRPDAWYKALGDRVFHLGPERDRNLVDGLALADADDPAAASFVLNTGPDHLADPAEAPSYDPVLQRCAEHRLPMICANPDLEVIRGGVRVLCAGTLALRYLEMGGDVRMLGKPDPRIYDPVLKILGLPKGRVLAVGDALRTDIAGAAAIGVDSCWVLGGLHGEHLGDEADIRAEAERAELKPVAAIRHLVW